MQSEKTLELVRAWIDGEEGWTKDGVESRFARLGWRNVEATSPELRRFRIDEQLEVVVTLKEDQFRSAKIVLDECHEKLSIDDLEYDETFDAFEDNFNALTEAISAVVGEPDFSDGSVVKGFPQDQEALMLSLWRVRGVRLMLQYWQEGYDTPFFLSLIAAV